jgi:outer membrane protein OmpA-like peptidoglycan-associated protein
MKYFLLLIITLLLSSCQITLSAQSSSDSFEKKFERAETIFSKVYQDGKSDELTYEGGHSFKEGYTSALPVFLELLKEQPSNASIAFKIAICYQSSRSNRARAIPYLINAAKSISADYKGSSYLERRSPLLTNKVLGDAYHLNNEFDKAITTYQLYLKSLKDNDQEKKGLIAETERKINMCKVGIILVKAPLNLKIENLGPAVNSGFADYSPVLTADQQTMFFTSRRQGTGTEKDDEGNHMEDIYVSTKTAKGWSKASSIGTPVNTLWHEATVGISPDGFTILVYKDDNGDGNIYSTSLNGDVWSAPVKLNDNINSRHWEPSAFFSADGNTLYFTSDRPGGSGGRDLYVSKRAPGGDWQKAVNMGPTINTPYDEDAPFMHPDGQTLTFSSNGHETMGGFDIFSSQLLEDGTWSKPANVGYPINTTDDDIFYVLSPDNTKAYFSSFRKGGSGEKDNYSATFLDRKKTALTIVQGIVKDDAKKTPPTLITVTDNESGEIAAVYNSNTRTGKFLFILTPGKNYNITYQSPGYLFYSDNLDIPKNSTYYEINKTISLLPIVVGSKTILNNIFFDFDKSTLRPLSNVEIRNLVTLLQANPALQAEISGHTDNKGDAAYNQKLSEERAQAVVDKLVEAGIASSRVSAKGYGKSQPVAANSNNGIDNPEGRQENRRVELKIIDIKK